MEPTQRQESAAAVFHLEDVQHGSVRGELLTFTPSPLCLPGGRPAQREDCLPPTLSGWTVRVLSAVQAAHRSERRDSMSCLSLRHGLRRGCRQLPGAPRRMCMGLGAAGLQACRRGGSYCLRSSRQFVSPWTVWSWTGGERQVWEPDALLLRLCRHGAGWEERCRDPIRLTSYTSVLGRPSSTFYAC